MVNVVCDSKAFLQGTMIIFIRIITLVKHVAIHDVEQCWISLYIHMLHVILFVTLHHYRAPYHRHDQADRHVPHLDLTSGICKRSARDFMRPI
jgi:hypothetical protein